MQPIGFNSSLSSFQRINAAPFSAPNFSTVPSAHPADEVLFGGRIKSATLKSRNTGKLQPATTERKTKKSGSSRFRLKLRNQREYASGVLSEQQKEAAEAKVAAELKRKAKSKENKPNGDTRNKNVIAALREYLTETQKKKLDRITASRPGSEEPESIGYKERQARHPHVHNELALAEGERSMLLQTDQPVPDELERKIHALDKEIRKLDPVFLHLINPELDEP